MARRQSRSALAASVVVIDGRELKRIGWVNVYKDPDASVVVIDGRELKLHRTDARNGQAKRIGRRHRRP